MDADKKTNTHIEHPADHEARIAALETEAKRAKRRAAAAANVREGKSRVAVRGLNQTTPK